MRWLWLTVWLAGCAAQGVTSSTPVDFVNAIAKDGRSHCISVSVPGFGTISDASAGDRPGIEVNQTGASCTIKTGPGP